MPRLVNAQDLSPSRSGRSVAQTWGELGAELQVWGSAESSSCVTCFVTSDRVARASISGCLAGVFCPYLTDSIVCAFRPGNFGC